MANEQLEGSVERITYYNDENGYSVIRLEPTSALKFWNAADQQGLVTVIGNLPELIPGETVRLDGRWETHSTYGRQFRAENCERILPATVEGMRRYLGSGMIKGIGPTIAGRIVDHFGIDTLQVLDDTPDRLYEVEGVGPKRVRLIGAAWQDQKHIEAVMLFLQSHGVSTNLAVKIHKEYGEESIKLLKENPYRMARDIRGVGFKTADRIAQDMGLPFDHPKRLEAGLAYTLTTASDDGHLYQPEGVLLETAAELLGVAAETLDGAIERAAGDELVKIDALLTAEDEEAGRAIYLPINYHSERGAARRLRLMLDTPGSHLGGLRRDMVDQLIAEVAAQSNVELSSLQEASVRAALTNKVSVLTGGPGTGKTTALRSLIRVLQMERYSFALASPTGRAAKRLSEATGQPAKTIHRMLGFTPGGGWQFNEDNPLPADIVIVDEVSMLDQVLAYSLFRAIDPRSHLLLVGDVDQLPSVGAGDVLRDLIASDQFAVTRLDVIFRQAHDSGIITNAHRINAGQQPLYDDLPDFFVFNIGDDAERVGEMTVDIVQNRAPERFRVNAMDDIQVIVPMYRGPSGVSALNQSLQDALNPAGGRLAEYRLAGRMWRAGDKVLQTVNDYDKDVFNGDVGRIRSFDPVEQTMNIVFDGRQVRYDWSDVSDLTHAYAISVHRSQGSEYPVVVMPIITSHYMLLQRNLLYTAITRAKQAVVLVGSRKAIRIAVGNDAVSRRYTGLADRLREP